MASFKTKTSCTGILYGRLLVQIILLHLLIFNCVGSTTEVITQKDNLKKNATNDQFSFHNATKI